MENTIARMITSGRKFFGGFSSSPIVRRNSMRFKSAASPPTASSFTRRFGSARFSPPRSSLSSSLPPRQEEDALPARYSISSEYKSAAWEKTQKLIEKQAKEAEDQRLKEEKEQRKKEEELAALKKGKFQCGKSSCKNKRIFRRSNSFTLEDLKNHFKDYGLHSEDNPTVLYACRKCHDTFCELKDFENEPVSMI